MDNTAASNGRTNSFLMMFLSPLLISRLKSVETCPNPLKTRSNPVLHALHNLKRQKPLICFIEKVRMPNFSVMATGCYEDCQFSKCPHSLTMKDTTANLLTFRRLGDARG